MINAERFKEEILNIANDDFYLAVNKNNPNGVSKCGSFPCADCMFSKLEDGKTRCTKNRMNWLLAEYKGPPVKVSKLEYDILKYLSDNTAYLYIARDSTSNLFAYRLGPTKGTHGWNSSCYTPVTVFNKLFLFIKWEDEESTSIKDVLENCVVKEIEEEQ